MPRPTPSAIALALLYLMTCVGAHAAWLPFADLDAETTREVVVYAGQAKVINAPWPTTRIAVTDPETADIESLGLREVLVLGKSVGITDIRLWGPDEQVVRYKVRVRLDISHLEERIHELFPDSEINLRQSNGSLIVSGTFRRAEQAMLLEEFLGKTGLEYVDNTRLAGTQQVQLKVRLAEVNRTVVRALTINGFVVGSDYFLADTIGSQSGPFNPVSIGVPGGTPVAQGLPYQFLNSTSPSAGATLFGALMDHDMEMFVQALKENSYARILAEPTLVAASGEEASFLSGGEYPIPVVQGGSSGGSSVSVEYRQYGVSLTFRPVVLGDGTIRLRVSPEVSDLSEVGSVEIQGFNIPATNVRRSETTLEMKSGQTFAMAGLIQKDVGARKTRVPILGDIPVLGALFRSVRYSESNSELLVLVTPTLTEPLDNDDVALPGESDRKPNDWEFYGLGRIDPGKPTPRRDWVRKLGLDRLKGPGAWSDSEDQWPAPYLAGRNETEK